jgi:excisionase family DNA binding protein
MLEVILCLLPTGEAQALLRLSKRSLVKLRQSGRLPYVSIGRAVRYRRSDLKAFGEENRRVEKPVSEDEVK